jgi:ACS family glucarate transporter-like MFS transporter
VLTAVTGAAFNYTSLLVIRFLFGAGEAGCFPALTKVAFFWFPVKERGLITGINFSGSRIGAAFALPLVAAMIVGVGWRMSFVIFGVVGVIFALSWWFFIKDKPEESTLVGDKEREYIIANRQKPAEKKNFLSYGRVLSEGNVWLAMTQYICSNFTFYFTLTWMFPYIAERFSLPPIKTGLYAMLPLLGGALGNWLSGIIVDAVYKGGKHDLSRRLPAIIGFIMAASGMIMVTRVDSVAVAVIFMTIAVMGADMTLPPSWSFCVDIGKDNSGLVSGTMNMAGNLGAFITILAFPYLKKWTGNYETFFYICAGLSVIAIFAWMAMRPQKPIVGKEVA